MKKQKILVALIIGAAMVLTACAKENDSETGSLFEPTENVSRQEEADHSEEKTEVITEDQAYNAVINYCKATNPEFDEGGNAEGYTEYWDVSTNENGEIVVLYRSYTAAQIRYYVNPTSGETYVTEYVPGIIDEEQRTDETFNIRDYLEAGITQTSSGN